MLSKRQTDRQTDNPTTVTLAAHARRGFITITGKTFSTKSYHRHIKLTTESNTHLQPPKHTKMLIEEWYQTTLTFVSHLDLAEVKFLERAVGQETQFKHVQPVVSTSVV